MLNNECFEANFLFLQYKIYVKLKIVFHVHNVQTTTINIKNKLCKSTNPENKKAQITMAENKVIAKQNKKNDRHKCK